MHGPRGSCDGGRTYSRLNIVRNFAGMAQLQVTLAVRPKWWMRPVLWASVWALHFGLIRDKPSTEHFGGIITADERVSRWLANYAFRFEVR